MSCHVMSCMYVCMYVCMHVCMYVCMYVCVYVCMCVYIYIYIHIYIYIYTHNGSQHSPAAPRYPAQGGMAGPVPYSGGQHRVPPYDTTLYIYVYMYKCINVYIYIYTHIHTYIHIYIHASYNITYYSIINIVMLQYHEYCDVTVYYDTLYYTIT